MPRLLFLFLMVITLNNYGQTNYDISETDSLPNKIVLYLPTADNARLNLLKNEFTNYSQIEKAVYYFQDNNALLIEFSSSVSSRLIYYADIVKVVSQVIPRDEIRIKTPISYSEISNGNVEDLSTFILK